MQDAVYVWDWATLALGDDLCILPEDGPQLAGRVDPVTEECTILWLHLAAGEGRKLFLRSEGLVVWNVPASRENASREPALAVACP